MPAKPLKEQLKEHKTELLVGAAGVAAAVALYVRSKKSTSTSTTTTPETVVTSALPGTTVATTTGTDAYNGMEDQILGLQAALLGLKTGGGASTAPSGTTLPGVTTGGSLRPAGVTVVGNIPWPPASSGSTSPASSGAPGTDQVYTMPAAAAQVEKSLQGLGDDKTGTRNQTMGIPIADVTPTMLEPTATGKYTQTKPTAVSRYDQGAGLAGGTMTISDTALQRVDAGKAA